MNIKGYKQLVPYSIFLIIGILFFPSSGLDDSHITYWAAYTLSNFGEILNYNGERIEQSSSLLHTLILASINYITHINIVDIGTYTSVFFGLLTIYLTGQLSLLVKLDKLTSQILTATSVPLVYWSFGALEASIVSAIILFLLISLIKFTDHVTIKNYFLVIIAIILYLLVRPEAFFVISLLLFILFTFFFFRKERYSPFIILFVMTFFLFIAILIFRYSYFGAFFPQPVEAKMGASIIEKIYSGIGYYKTALKQYPFFLFLAIPVVFYITIKSKETMKSKNLIIIISLLLTYALFILAAGGDWMRGARFFVPIIGPSTIIASLFYTAMIGPKRTILYGTLSNLILILYFSIQFSYSYPIFYYNEYVKKIPETKEFSFFQIASRGHYRDIPFIIEFRNILKQIIANDMKPTIMSIQAGMVPYHIFQDYYKQARFIDLFGLSTRDFTECEITSSLPKRAYGISMSYEYFFSHLDLLQERCNINAPDIIYDLDVEELTRMSTIEASGYTVVYLQTGIIVNDGLFKGGYVGGTQFIAVKNNIVSEIGLKMTRFKFK
jgi:hypothetical protein